VVVRLSSLLEQLLLVMGGSKMTVLLLILMPSASPLLQRQPSIYGQDRLLLLLDHRHQRPTLGLQELTQLLLGGLLMFLQTPPLVIFCGKSLSPLFKLVASTRQHWIGPMPSILFVLLATTVKMERLGLLATVL